MHVSQIRPGFWRLSFPWVANPSAKTSEVYVINGSRNTVVVDLSKASIVDPAELLKSIEQTGAHMDNLQVFLTHYHLDHSGNAKYFLDAGYPITGGVHEIATPPGEDPQRYFPTVAGIPEDLWDEHVLTYMDVTYPAASELSRVSKVAPGEVVEVAPWLFEVIMTPGHASESCCLFDRNTGILVSGDTIVGGFIPPVNTTSLDLGKMAAYLRTLGQLRDYPITAVLPGHQGPVLGRSNVEKRIGEIEKAYQRRIGNSQRLLQAAGRECTAYELTNARGPFQQSGGKEQSSYNMISHVAMTLSYLEYMHGTGFASRHRAGLAAYYRYIPAPR